MFALPDNEVITVYKNEIDAENARIKIDGTLYSLENDGVHAIIDGEEAAKTGMRLTSRMATPRISLR